MFNIKVWWFDIDIENSTSDIEEALELVLQTCPCSLCRKWYNRVKFENWYFMLSWYIVVCTHKLVLTNCIYTYILVYTSIILVQNFLILWHVLGQLVNTSMLNWKSFLYFNANVVSFPGEILVYCVHKTMFYAHGSI